jgi:hypothetical protein
MAVLSHDAEARDDAVPRHAAGAWMAGTSPAKTLKGKE